MNKAESFVGGDKTMKAEKGEKELTECPDCGCTEFYKYSIISGKVKYIESFDGTEQYNGEMYDNCHFKDLKTRFCLNCERKLPR